MKEVYQELELRILFYENTDVIAASKDEETDDLGAWNDAWFTKP